MSSSQLLRIATAGSVDDGKSTLIGRLLYDSKAIFEDQLDAVAHTSRARGHDAPDLSLLTDGLRAEREQGITIDVAYRYFATPKRKFIIADTPGHIQYTRNMVTGASTADVAMLLIDARNGVLEQSRRHAFLATLLGRHGLNSDLGFGHDDRAENVRRVSEVAQLLADAGVVSLVSLVSPYRADRDTARRAHEAAGLPFLEVFVDTPLDVCEARDVKGMYARARAGEIPEFTGVSAPYEAPHSPDVLLRPEDGDPGVLAQIVLERIERLL